MGKVVIDLDELKDKKIHRAWYRLTAKDGTIPATTGNTTAGLAPPGPSPSPSSGSGSGSREEPGLSSGPDLVPAEESAFVEGASSHASLAAHDAPATGGTTRRTATQSGQPNEGGIAATTTTLGEADDAATSASTSPDGTYAPTPPHAIDVGLGSIEVILWWKVRAGAVQAALAGTHTPTRAH